MSSTGLFATVGTTVGGAAAVLLTAGVAFADDPQFDPLLDLPVTPQTKPAPKAPIDNPPTTNGDDTPPKFFGTEVKSETQSIVYVIDQSGSMSLTVQPFQDDQGNMVMAGTRLDRAKSELRRSIATLPEIFKFDVIFYDECVRPWQAGCVPATTANKQAAFGWINGQEPMGFTNTGLAVATALADKTNKMVVLLSDGEPNFLDCAAQYVGTYDQHKEMIKNANTQNATINCFGIGVEANPDARKFMQDVAAENYGTYVECN
jgi:hypothetical protein